MSHTPAPVNRFLAKTLMALTRGELQVEAFAHQPEKLLDQVRVSLG